MTTARDILHTGVTCVREHETITGAARHLPEHAIVSFIKAICTQQAIPSR